ncbi:MAG: hypothetical protein IKK80_04440 [Treponema sp.]|nr:hypothetical protein [Treponema sp.]
MKKDISVILRNYFSVQENIFSVSGFMAYLKSKGIKLSFDEALGILNSSNYVFPLINDEFITRAGVFTNKWFSIKPSKEEIKKDRLVLGHRCMPFINPDIPPCDIKIITPTARPFPRFDTFSMNFALDVFAFYGEGYVIPYIINDRANKDFSLQSVQDSLPNQTSLTCWTLSQVAGRKMNYGERLLCRVVDWPSNTIEVQLIEKELPQNKEELQITVDDLQRERWYNYFEKGFLESFEKNGPSGSIEEQLALLFLENIDVLCVKNCGSSEEFLRHTKQIGFANYGVESRIWRTNEVVPYVGNWNNEISDELMLAEISSNFTPQIIDAYLHQNLFCKNHLKPTKTIEEIAACIFPPSLIMNKVERTAILLNLEKRNDILNKKYLGSFDNDIAPLRERTLNLFTQVNKLMCSIGGAKLDMKKFPQSELVILTQLYGHIINIIDELENIFLRLKFPVNDVMLSLNGMEETFIEIKSVLERSKAKLFKESFKIV